MGDTYSEVKDNNQGVPQGSQIGPILFLIYMNEIFGRIIECHIVAYADDLLLIVGHKDLHVAQEKMQLDFNTLMKWAHDKGLVINAQKTCMMHIFPKNMRFETEAKIKCHNCDCLNNVQIRNDCQCENITLVDKCKYLGITVDSKVTWKEHVMELKKKLNPCVASMYRIGNKVNAQVKEMVYKSLIESHFRYAIGIWGSTATTHMNILRNLQERCIKILMGRQLVANVAANKYSISGILTPKGLYTYTKIINH